MAVNEGVTPLYKSKYSIDQYRCLGKVISVFTIYIRIYSQHQKVQRTLSIITFKVIKNPNKLNLTTYVNYKKI